MALSSSVPRFCFSVQMEQEFEWLVDLPEPELNFTLCSSLRQLRRYCFAFHDNTVYAGDFDALASPRPHMLFRVCRRIVFVSAILDERQAPVVDEAIT